MTFTSNHKRLGKAIYILALMLCSTKVVAAEPIQLTVDFAEFAKSHTVSTVFVKATGEQPIAPNMAMTTYSLAFSFSSDVVKVDVPAGQTSVNIPIQIIENLNAGVTITLMCNDGSYVTMKDGNAIKIGDNSTHNYVFDESEATQNNWMATIPSKVKFNMLTLPGAHDAATSKVSTNASKTQSLTIKEQLAAGVRALDLRPRYTSSKESDIELDNLEIYHGSTATGVKWKDAMDAILDFLKNNPTETVFINLQKEDASEKNDYTSIWRTSIRTYLADHGDQVLQQITANMTLSDCRGKTVVVSHNPYGSENVYNDIVYGGLTSNWDDNATFDATINYTWGSAICSATISDNYDESDNEKKQGYIRTNLYAANADTSTKWYYTFVNVGYQFAIFNPKYPSTFAETHNAYVYNLLQSNTYNSRLGIVFYDFCGATYTPELLQALIQHNYKYLYPSDSSSEEIYTVDAGEYYLYNIKSGKYLTFGTNYGTRASLVENAGATLNIAVSGLGNKVTFPEITKSQKGLFLDGSNLPFCDNEPYEFAFLKTATEGVYTISAAGKYLCCRDDASSVEPSPLEAVDDANNEGALWRLVTRQERIDALMNATIDNPVDATFYIKGAEIDEHFDNAGAWEGDTPTYGGRTGNLEATGYAAENYWGANAESYQTLTNLPAGKYQVSCYGFYRDGSYTDAYEKHTNGTENIQAFLFANNEQTPLSSIMVGAANNGNDGGANVGNGTLWIPDNMEQAVLYFFRKRYPAVTVDVTIKADEPLKLGVKKEAGTEQKWAIWDRFRLTYIEPYISVIAEPFSGNGDLVAGQWYAYNADTDGHYEFSATEDIEYTINDALLSEVNTEALTTEMVLSAGIIYFKSGKNQSLTITKLPDTDNVTITEAKYTAYVTIFDTDFTKSEGITAYKVTEATTAGATLEPIDNAPKSTAVILNGEANNYTIHRATNAVTETTGNKFLPGGSTSGNGTTIYALGNKDGVGFYLVKEGVEIPANKGYLEITGNNPIEGIKTFIPFGDTVTGIESITTEDDNEEPIIYNIAGQRVGKEYKGIVIDKNGKKYLNK